eukprot:TRINITY_DN54565_c0_g1_i1.p1 TRINITY_DN54565_c0_g1~~TRINITY_DN54565_c0_g1_i1.p1  ORF type:complete len:471 (+),score=120.84 TRINITY_DN54565_c0_g1_i1:84-1496(+)
MSLRLCGASFFFSFSAVFAFVRPNASDLIGAAGLEAPRVVTIPLSKQYVPVMRKGRAVMHKTAYFGELSLGDGDFASKFRVVFDTGSGHLFVPSSACSSSACATKRTYRQQPLALPSVTDEHNGSAAEEPRDEVAIAYGTGEVEGEIVRETVCLQAPGAAAASAMATSRALCARTRVVLATSMSEEPFSEFDFDGVLGLGLEALAVDAEHSVMSQLVAQNAGMEPRFGVFLGFDGEPSQITFGGHDSQRLASELRWADVVRPELGHWMLQIRSVKVGDRTLPLCDDGDCFAVADTGTSLLGVPAQISKQMNLLLARVVPEVPGETVDCRDQEGPDIVLDVGGVEIRLDSRDYTRPAGLRVVRDDASSQLVCRAQVLPISPVEPLGNKAWILGEPVLRRYHTVFDWGNRRVGFGRAKRGVAALPSAAGAASQASSAAAAAALASQGEGSARGGDIIGAPTAEILAPTVVQI